MLGSGPLGAPPLPPAEPRRGGRRRRLQPHRLERHCGRPSADHQCPSREGPSRQDGSTSLGPRPGRSLLHRYRERRSTCRTQPRLRPRDPTVLRPVTGARGDVSRSGPGLGWKRCCSCVDREAGHGAHRRWPALVDPAAGRLDGWGVTGDGWADDLVVDSAEAVARYVDGPAAGGPAVTRNARGGGRPSTEPVGQRPAANRAASRCSPVAHCDAPAGDRWTLSCGLDVYGNRPAATAATRRGSRRWPHRCRRRRRPGRSDRPPGG